MTDTLKNLVSIDQRFVLLPLNLPQDGPQILHLLYQSYLTETNLQPHPPSGPISETQFINTHLPYSLSSLSSPGLKTAKLTPLPTPANPNPTLVAYTVLKPPVPEFGEKSEVERREEVRNGVRKMGCENEEAEEVTFQMMWEGKRLNERFLGKGYECRFWLLDGLHVDVEWQRRGLGRRLVEWCVGTVTEEIGKNKVERMGTGGEDVVDVDGVYLISSPAGEGVYRQSGFERLGELAVPSVTEGEEAFVFSWYVKRI